MLNKKICQRRIPAIKMADLRAVLKEKNGVLLDVRTPQEYQAGHLTEARNLPLNQVSTYQGPKNQPVYLVCQSGQRSKRAARLLQEKGYVAVNVQGGLTAYSGHLVGGK